MLVFLEMVTPTTIISRGFVAGYLRRLEVTQLVMLAGVSKSVV